VYLDPPYVSAHKNNGFLRYNATVFTWCDQLRLARFAEELCARGAWVLISNADHPSIRALYHFLRAHRVSRASLVAGDSDRRGVVTELLMSNYPLRVDGED
jgi:DNA adenine methylase